MPGKGKKASQKKQKVEEQLNNPEEDQVKDEQQIDMREDDEAPTDSVNQDEAQQQPTPEKTESKNAGGSTRELSVEQETTVIPEEVPPLTPSHSIDPVPEDEVNKVDDEPEVTNTDLQCALTSPTNNLPAVIDGEEEEQLTDRIPDTHSSKYHREDSSFIVPVSPKPIHQTNHQEDEEVPTFAHQNTHEMDNLPIGESEVQKISSPSLSKPESRKASLWHEPVEPTLELESTKAYKAIYYSWLQIKLGYLFMTRNHAISG